MFIVPDPQNRTDVYLSGEAWTTFSKSFRMPLIMLANSFSLGQMSGTTCAIFTVSVVVAGPGFSSMFLFIFIFNMVGFWWVYTVSRKWTDESLLMVHIQVVVDEFTWDGMKRSGKDS